MMAAREAAVSLLRIGTLVLLLVAAAVAVFHARPDYEPEMLPSSALRSGEAPREDFILLASLLTYVDYSGAHKTEWAALDESGLCLRHPMPGLRIAADANDRRGFFPEPYVPAPRRVPLPDSCCHTPGPR